jgi:hypothetical protein
MAWAKHSGNKPDSHAAATTLTSEPANIEFRCVTKRFGEIVAANSALAETAFHLSRNAKKALPRLKDLGHLSAHGRHFTAQASDIDKSEDGVRVVVEEFLHLAGLL